MRTATIVGGGIGGLAAAISLSRAGMACTLIERNTTLGTGGTGLTLWPNALRRLDRLGLQDAVLAHARPLRRGEIYDQRARRLSTVDLAAIQEQSGKPLICIRRTDLYKVLLDAMQGVEVREATRCLSYDNHSSHIDARLDDGSVLSSDLLVAADGIRSRLRRQMLDSDPLSYVGWMTWRGVAHLPKGTFPEGIYREFFGRGSRFGIFAIREDVVYWYGTRNGPADERAPIDPAHRDEALRAFAGWPDPAQTVIAATEPQDLVRTGVYDTKPLTQWSDGRAVLLGDAAHPMTPDLGQGACQALEDALTLADCIEAAPDVPAALRAYGRQGHARTADLVARSRKVGTMRQWQNVMATAFRNGLMRMIPPRLLLKLFNTR
jgi:2-polyprenyl-6-methoxyphenol hydroxylase-like FAD-dependent oxidoreductase